MTENKLFNLQGKIALVTGASRGLGKAITLGLAQAGSDVAVADVLNTAETVEEIKKIGRTAIGISVDVSEELSVASMVDQVIEKFGRIDILVNNAGILKSAPAEEMAEQDWDKVMKINLKGQFLCARQVGKQMIKQKSGKIINVASIAGLAAFAQTAAYNASKAGVILMTKTLAIEWGKHNIRVNAICPGVFATAMTKNFLKDENFVQMIKNKVPLGRYGQPEELIGAAIYLASDASSYLTGHALVVDGGYTAGI